MKKLLIAVMIVLASGTAYAGVPHTSYGIVTAGQAGDNWHFYLVPDPSSTQEGTLTEASGTAFYQVIVGNLDWSTGDDSLIFVARETGAGTVSHTGYYAVMNEDLDTTHPQLYNPCEVRPIPVPAAQPTATRIQVTWTAAATDISETPRGNNIAGYNVYRSENQASGFTRINTALVAGTSFVDATGTPGVVYYYAIEPVFRGGVALGAYSAASNAATYPVADGTVYLSLTYDPNRGNIFWISLPYGNDFLKASDVIAKINADHGLSAVSGERVTQIGRWDSSSQLYETYDYLGFLGWSGSNFDIVTGEAVFINIAADVTASLPGIHDPAFGFNVAHNPNSGNIFWFSLPVSGSSGNAVEIIAELNQNAGLADDSGGLVSQVGRWNGSTQAFETYDYLGFLGWSGTNFSVVSGEGYFISLVDDVSDWHPGTN